MTAFDTAWSVVKAPLIVDSVNPQNVEWSSTKTPPEPVARFLDPVTGEEHPMTAKVIGENVHVAIRGPGPWTPRGHRTGREEIDRAEATFNRPSAPLHEPSQVFSSGGTSTWGPYRNRGYMTAIYDLAAILADRGALGLMRRVAPSTLQSLDGMRFWEGQTGVRPTDAFSTGYVHTTYPEGTYWPVIEEDRPPVPIEPVNRPKRLADELEEEWGEPL